MACEQNILDVPISATVPDAAELVLFTDPNSGLSVLRAWSTMQNGALPADETYVVQPAGTTTDQIVNGEPSFTLTTFINRRVRLFRGGMLQPNIPISGGSYYSFDAPSGTFTVTPLPGTDEYFTVQAY